MDLLAQLAKHAALTDCNGSSPSSAVLTWSEEQLKNLAVLFVRCSSYPNVEVAVPGMLAMAALGQRDFALREATAGAGGLLSPVLNALLTNALLRRLQEPSAYASETAQQNKQMRLLEGSMQAMDSAFNAVIDLHTSDEKVFLANYAKLQCAAKLQERGEFFAQQLHSAAVAKLDQNDLEKFSETLENLESFIKYKTGFV